MTQAQLDLINFCLSEGINIEQGKKGIKCILTENLFAFVRKQDKETLITSRRGKQYIKLSVSEFNLLCSYQISIGFMSDIVNHE